MNDQTSSGDRSRNKSIPGGDGHSPWVWVRVVLLGIVMAGVIGLVIALPLLPTGRVVLEEGDVSPEDVRAPRSVTYVSATMYSDEQERVASIVPPVHTKPDPALARQQLDRARLVLDYLVSVRADNLASRAQHKEWILAVDELAEMPSEMLDALLSLSEDGWNLVQLETPTVIDQLMRLEIREQSLEVIRGEAISFVRFDLSDEEAAVTAALAQRFLVPNAFLDAAATAEAQARAREEVPPVLRTFEAGEIIVREGERVAALDIEALDELGLRQPHVEWIDFVGAALLAALGTTTLMLYLARFQPNVLWDGQQHLLLTLLTSVAMLGVGLMVPAGVVLRFLFPAPALAMLVTAALGPHAGVATAILLGGVSGVVADGSLEMVVFAASGAVVAALSLGPVKRIGEIFRSGVYAALAHFVVAIIFHLPQDAGQTGALLVSALAGFANGGISASLALGGLYVIGPLFDIVTTMRLVELSRPDRPLLRRLLRESPATYHHSLMVANLAEQAAERISADAMLTRVGAYYHDIGKMVRPYYFTENQVPGVNPHDRLDPYTSAEILVGHVKDGQKLARSYRLPRRVRAFIPEHHGTSWVSFFYDKAVQQAGDAALVDREVFRHIGPRPQSKETALVMLADGCEAAVRSARTATEEDLALIVNGLISSRVDDGQLNECGFTLSDLAVIREVFVSSLKGVFHPRIQYPQSKVEAGASVSGTDQNAR